MSNEKVLTETSSNHLSAHSGYMTEEGVYVTEKFKVPTSAEINTQLDNLAQKHGVNRRNLMVKCDLWIVLPICILYLLAFLDRVNISNAKVYGMATDLKMNTTQFNTALTIFFVPYVVFEVPANYLLKKFRPHIWLSGCMLLFGAVSIGQGFVKSYHALIATRFLLGLLETGMFPGCFYLLSTWYRREEAQKRYSFFFSSTSLAGAFGGLIAYRMNNLDGKQGIRSWQWLFIVEGAITCFVALILFFLISDFPEDAKFLKENERAYIKEKLALESGESYYGERTQVKRIFEVFKDWKVWCAGLMYFGLIVGAYGYAFFAPAIISTFGYSPVKTQVYSIFPWICSFGMSMVVAFFSDLVRHRYVFTLVLNCLVFVGLGMLLGIEPVPSTVHTRYAALFLIVVGIYACMPLYVCWTNLNFAGHYRKMVGSAWQIGFGNTGGIISTYIFDKPPKFTKGYSISLAMAGVSMISATVYFIGIYRENQQKISGKATAKFEALSEEDKALAGDRNPSFIYQY